MPTEQDELNKQYNILHKLGASCTYFPVEQGYLVFQNYQQISPDFRGNKLYAINEALQILKAQNN